MQRQIHTVMSLLEAPYLIEAPQNGSASCHKIVASPSTPPPPPPPPPPTEWNKKIEAPGASNKNLTESIHKYIVQARYVLLKITRAATTTCFTAMGLHSYHVSVTHYKRPYDAQMTRNRNALGIVLAPGASNRDNTVRFCTKRCYL